MKETIFPTLIKEIDFSNSTTLSSLRSFLEGVNEKFDSSMDSTTLQQIINRSIKKRLLEKNL